jgi:hypothetical protein
MDGRVAERVTRGLDTVADDTDEEEAEAGRFLSNKR